MNSVEAQRVMAVVDDTLDSLRCKASTRTDKLLGCMVLLSIPVRRVLSHVTEEVLTGAEQLSGMVGQVGQETPV